MHDISFADATRGAHCTTLIGFPRHCAAGALAVPQGALTSCVETALAETRHAAVAAAAGAAVREDELAAVVRTGVHSRKAMRETQGVSQLLTIGMGEDAGPSAGRAGAGTMLPPAAQPMLAMAGGGAYGGGLDELMGLPPAPGPTPSTVAQPAPTTAGKGRCVHGHLLGAAACSFVG